MRVTPARLAHLGRLPTPLPADLPRPAGAAARAGPGRTTPSAPSCTWRCGRCSTCRRRGAHRGPRAGAGGPVLVREGFRDAAQAAGTASGPAAGWPTTPADLDPDASRRRAGALGLGQPPTRMVAEGRVDRIDRRGRRARRRRLQDRPARPDRGRRGRVAGARPVRRGRPSARCAARAPQVELHHLPSGTVTPGDTTRRRSARTSRQAEDGRPTAGRGHRRAGGAAATRTRCSRRGRPRAARPATMRRQLPGGPGGRTGGGAVGHAGAVSVEEPTRRSAGASRRAGSGRGPSAACWPVAWSRWRSRWSWARSSPSGPTAGPGPTTLIWHGRGRGRRGGGPVAGRPAPAAWAGSGGAPPSWCSPWWCWPPSGSPETEQRRRAAWSAPRSSRGRTTSRCRGSAAARRGRFAQSGSSPIGHRGDQRPRRPGGGEQRDRRGSGARASRRTARRATGLARSSGRTCAKYGSTSARLAGRSRAPSSAPARTCSARNRSSSASSIRPSRRTACANELTSATCTQRSRSWSSAA